MRPPHFQSHSREGISIRKILWVVLILVPLIVVGTSVLLVYRMKMENMENEGRKDGDRSTPKSDVKQHEGSTDADAETHSSKSKHSDSVTNFKSNSNSKTQIFYYPWYGNRETNGKWLHWRHRILEGDMSTILEPPKDIGANFYPQMGLYLSADEKTMDKHVDQMVNHAGVNVISYSWYPPGFADDELIIAGEAGYSDKILPVFLDVCAKYGAKVTIHVEPIKDVSIGKLRAHIAELLDKIGTHEALFRHDGKAVFYFYDSYFISERDWATLLKPGGAMSIRNTKHDFIAIGLLVEAHHQQWLLEAGFDGWYSYFGAESFTYGSTSANWPNLIQWSRSNNLLCMLCVAPGYDDRRIRPWNKGNRKDREKGQYYERMWRAAINAQPDWIGVTSYNEWHEGTQIEPAMSMVSNEAAKIGLSSTVYSDYDPLSPDSYLGMTKRLAREFELKH